MKSNHYNQERPANSAQLCFFTWKCPPVTYHHFPYHSKLLGKMKSTLPLAAVYSPLIHCYPLLMCCGQTYTFISWYLGQFLIELYT